MSTDFEQEIKNLQDRLQLKDLHSLADDFFPEYFKEVVQIYSAHIRQLKKLGKHNKHQLLNPFHFKNLNIQSLNWERFCESFPNLTTNLKKYISDRIVFENCTFSKVTFNHSGKIKHKFFEVTLSDCKVEHMAIRDDCGWNLEALLIDNCAFEKIDFKDKRPGNRHPTILNFSDCAIKRIICFQNVEFDYICFQNCKLGDQNHIGASVLSFNNAIFLSTTVFQNCDFFVSPKFHGATIHSDTIFYDSVFHDTRSESCMGDYRVLKQKAVELGADHTAMKFHALELEARKNTVLPSISNFKHAEWPAAAASHFLKTTNNYGRNFWLPVRWLLIVTALFAVIYWGLNGVECNYHKIDSADIWLRPMCQASQGRNWGLAVTFSMHRILGPVSLLFDVGVLDAKNWGIKILSVFQILFSSIYWYIFLVQLRRQFKL